MNSTGDEDVKLTPMLEQMLFELSEDGHPIASTALRAAIKEAMSETIAAHEAAHHLEIREGARAVEHVEVMTKPRVPSRWCPDRNARFCINCGEKYALHLEGGVCAAWPPASESVLCACRHAPDSVGPLDAAHGCPCGPQCPCVAEAVSYTDAEASRITDKLIAAGFDGSGDQLRDAVHRHFAGERGFVPAFLDIVADERAKIDAAKTQTVPKVAHCHTNIACGDSHCICPCGRCVLTRRMDDDAKKAASEPAAPSSNRGILGSTVTREQADALLHPNGACVCGNEGQCEWCRSVNQETGDPAPASTGTSRDPVSSRGEAVTFVSSVAELHAIISAETSGSTCKIMVPVAVINEHVGGLASDWARRAAPPPPPMGEGEGVRGLLVCPVTKTPCECDDPTRGKCERECSHPSEKREAYTQCSDCGKVAPAPAVEPSICPHCGHAMSDHGEHGCKWGCAWGLCDGSGFGERGAAGPPDALAVEPSGEVAEVLADVAAFLIPPTSDDAVDRLVADARPLVARLRAVVERLAARAPEETPASVLSGALTEAEIRRVAKKARAAHLHEPESDNFDGDEGGNWLIGTAAYVTGNKGTLVGEGRAAADAAIAAIRASKETT